MKRGLVEHRSNKTASNEEFLTMLKEQSGSVEVTSKDTAMKIATVFRCVSILSGTIASLPLNIRRKTKKGNFAIDESNPLYYLLRWKASSRLNSYEMMEAVVAQILLDGNSYIFPKFKDGKYSELVLLTKGTVIYDELTDRYMISDYINGIFGTYDSWRIIHLRNKNLDGSKIGVSTIQYAGRALNITANADNQTLSNMKTGNKQKGFLSGGSALDGMGKLKDTVVDAVAERLESELNSDKSVMRLPGEVKWQNYSISPADAQILENRQFSVFEICRYFGVHPDKVFVQQSNNYKASENSQTSFMTDTLQPLLVQIEKEFTTKLLPKGLVGVREVIQYDRNALYQIDPISSATLSGKQFEYGGKTTNEIRIANNDEPVDGGDVAFVSANVAPIKSAKIYGEPQVVS